MTNPLFDDLDKVLAQQPEQSVKAMDLQPTLVPEQSLVSQEELSQLRLRQLALKQEPQVQTLAQRIDPKNQIAILEFGKETAKGISTFSDRILGTLKQSDLEKSTTLLASLNTIMKRFDPQDFKESENKGGLLKRLFSRGKVQLETILSKYDTMNKEVDKVYTEIQKYEIEMKRTTMQLEQMYDENLHYFRQLSEHVAAIEIKVEQLQKQLPVLALRADQGEQVAAMELESMNRAIELLQQRAYDLEMAQQVSFQSAPQIRLMQQGNSHLISKINSAFVTTIPIFKQGLIHAVTLQRQKLVSDSMTELDRRTNEMLMRNAENIRQNAVELAHRANNPSIKIETIEQTWQSILTGIEETKQIQVQTLLDREEGRKKIEQLQIQYEKLKSM